MALWILNHQWIKQWFPKCNYFPCKTSDYSVKTSYNRSAPTVQKQKDKIFTYNKESATKDCFAFLYSKWLIKWCIDLKDDQNSQFYYCFNWLINNQLVISALLLVPQVPIGSYLPTLGCEKEADFLGYPKKATHPSPSLHLTPITD